MATGQALHRNYVSRIERGKVVPTLRTVERLAGGLATAPSALIAESERYAARVADFKSRRPG